MTAVTVKTKSTTGNTSPINTAWFRARLADVEKSQRQLADHLERDPSAVSLLLKGERKMQLTEAEAIAKFLKVPLNDVLEQAGLNTAAGARDSALIVGVVGPTGRVTMEKARGIEARRVVTPSGMPPSTRALLFKAGGPSNNWTAFYVPRDGIDPDALGRPCVITLDVKEKPVYFGILERGYDKGTFDVRAMIPGSGSASGMSGSDQGGLIFESTRVLAAAPVDWLKLG